MSELVSIIIPTYNNYRCLQPLAQSMVRTATKGLYKVYVVNNGDPHSCDWLQHPMFEVINTGKNLGWEGGLLEGLKHVKTPFVMFLNDDTHIPDSSKYWIHEMLQHFRHQEVGAVGPGTNNAMGLQSIFANPSLPALKVNFLIFYCVLMSMEALQKAGGVDNTLPGGDDIDLSIRLRKAGYKLIADRNVFIYHHGMQTGSRVFGDQTKVNGWNSPQFTDKVNHALIKKHGFRTWYETLYTAPEQEVSYPTTDLEGEIIKKLVSPGKILDLGCGGVKTVEPSIGIDMIPKGTEIDTLGGTVSVADITADVSQELPEKDADTIIARHVLEHMMDPVEAINNWRKSLKKGGKLIIAVPNQDLIASIPMNIEHVHGFTHSSLKNLLEAIGMKVIEQHDAGNHISFVTVAENI